MTKSGTFALHHEVVPAQQGDPPYPGLLLLHGRGSNELDLLTLGPEIDPRLVVVSARAPFSFSPGSYYWYDLEASIIGRPSKEAIQHSLKLVRTLIAQSVPAYAIDPNRLFVGGFSMGGAMTSAVSLCYPESVAGGLIFSGYVPIYSNLDFKTAEADGLPIFQAHGIYDEVLPIQYGRMSRDFFLQTHVDLSYQEYPIGHTIIPEEVRHASEWMRNRLDGRVVDT